MRYSIRSNNGDVFEDADTADEAMEAVRDAAQEAIEEGKETDLDKAMSSYEIYDNVADAPAWTKKTGWLPRAIDVEEFVEESVPIPSSSGFVSYGHWKLTVEFRGEIFSATTTNEEHFLDRNMWAREIAWHISFNGHTIELDDK